MDSLALMHNALTAMKSADTYCATTIKWHGRGPRIGLRPQVPRHPCRAVSGPYPVSIREAAKATNLSEYTIRMVFDKLIDEGRLTRVAGHESRGVVLP